MPQETNLNISPYFDDYDPLKGYHKVLFKPGFPVQSRELTTLQSILQNQVEQIGTHLFKEGSVVIPGNYSYNNELNCVEVESQYLGINLDSFRGDLAGITIRGQNSNLKAKIVDSIGTEYSDRGYITLYINYLSTGNDDKAVFDDNELLILEENLNSTAAVFQQGQAFTTTAPTQSTSIGSAVFMQEGVYYLRGTFVKVLAQTLILEPHENNPSYRIGFEIYENIVTSGQDNSLNDNASGFNNYAAPGADRLQIRAVLAKRPIEVDKHENFVELFIVRSGGVEKAYNRSVYNDIGDELARRTYEQSGDFYVKSFSVSAKETLDDRKGNDGVFKSNQLTRNGNVPRESLGTYKISPGKAYVKGYEIEYLTSTYLDFQKPRTTSTLENQAINYFTGPSMSLNRVVGAPRIGFTTSSLISLRDSRIGENQFIPSGKEIGISRIYDYALEGGSYDTAVQELNTWDISLYDTQYYTELNLNSSVSWTTPVYIEGKSSGASGHLRFDTNSAGIATVYGTRGKFIKGEKLILNGVDGNSLITSVTEYKTLDVKSLHSTIGIGETFNADTKLSNYTSVGQVTVGQAVANVSTVVSTDVQLDKIFKVGDYVSFTNTGLVSPEYKTYGKVVSITDEYTIGITSVNEVTGINYGLMPSSSDVIALDFSLIGTKLQSSTDNTLYTPLPKKYISNVDLTESEITIRKEFNLVINQNVTNTIQCESDEAFLPFDEERYVLINSNGDFEVLTGDKFIYGDRSKSITIYGMSTNGPGRLIATLSKNRVTSRTKTANRANSIIVNKSTLVSSGIGSTTLDDGLEYGSYGYGLRVQDKEICLLEPDVTKVYAIFESSDTFEPVLPSLTLANLNGQTGRTDDLVISEVIKGETSEAEAIYVENINSSKISIVYLSDLAFIIGETVRSEKSNILGTISDIGQGSTNITDRYTLDSGQRDTICDYSRIIRKENSKSPKNQIKVIFESGEFSSSENGDITTANSYSQFDYCDLLSVKNDVRTSDIIDIRPRVLPFNSNSQLSPFEFTSRQFSDSNNSAKNILASDESIRLTYSHYLARIDKLFLLKTGEFQLLNGVPSEDPLPPIPIEDALEVATISIPPYLCDIDDCEIKLNKYKRYRMEDVGQLEQRVNNLEYYTALSLLESKAESLTIPDSNGLTRFKSGIYVDNFSTRKTQIKSSRVTNSIDPVNLELRPSHFTTQIDLLLGGRSLLGIGTTSGTVADSEFVDDLIGSNIRKTVQLLTLDYTDEVIVENPFATRVENVTPYLVTTYAGTIELFPSSDIWIDQTRLRPQTITSDDYTQTRLQLEYAGYDAQTGLGPIVWGSWETTWTGSTSTSTSSTTRSNWRNQSNIRRGRGTVRTDVRDVTTTTVTTTTQTGFDQRDGKRLRVSEQVETRSEGDRVVNTSVIPFMRSRNIEFTARRFKPFTRLYGFFDEQDVNQFIVPKLIEIRMIRGIFNVGDLVRGTRIGRRGRFFRGRRLFFGRSLPRIQFRVAKSNHKYGPISNPSDVYIESPYDQNYIVPAEYSSSSILLNVDTRSLSGNNQSLYRGFIVPGMRLRGPNGEAEVVNVRLFTDSIGSIKGSFFIPNPNVPSNPSFEAGTKVFRLTNSSTNTKIGGLVDSSGEEQYFASGTMNTVQETIRSTRKPRFEVVDTTERRPAVPDVQVTTAVDRSQETRSRFIPDPPPPPPPPPPAPPARPQVFPQPVSAGRGRPAPAPNQGRRGQRNPPRRNPPSAGRFARQLIRSTRNRDPLAQSFLVSETNGIFVTSVDLFFRTKDPIIPVTVQLRPMVNGYPTNEVCPFSEVVINPQQVFTSEDSLTVTEVFFPSPIYLEGNKEYAIVLLSDSNDYTVWISKMGEIDVSTLLQEESRQTLVSQQPDLGSLFKSQNGSTWTASQYEDLKFRLYAATFNNDSPGTISFFNPRLDLGNDQIATLVPDPLEFESRKVIITTTNVIDITSLDIGNTIKQQNNSFVRGDVVGYGGSASGQLTITNAGIGYTPSDGSSFTFNGVSLTSVSGLGKNATADITIGADGSTNGVAIAATINSGGFGYQQGDVVTIDSIGSQPLGKNAQFTISNINGINQLVVDNVQGNFENNTSKSLLYDNSLGITTTIFDTGGADSVISNIEISSPFEDGLHIKVNNKNHAMHSKTNVVQLSEVGSDIEPTSLTAEYTFSDSGPVSIASTTNFTTFENIEVSATNPGYILINDEIISYTGISNGTLTGITRQIDNTQSISYPEETTVFKYENNGISLRRINKLHYLQDALVPRSIGFDFYYIKLDTSQNGINRDSDPSVQKLYIRKSKSDGGELVNATQNIQYESMRPIVQTLVLPETNVTAKLKSITGTSVDSNEVSFLESPIVDITLDETNYFTEPRLITSTVNESIHNTNLISNKSLELELSLSSADIRVSPVVDLDRIGVILTSNRVNAPITDYVNDPRTSTLNSDPNEFIYCNLPVELENPATSLKVLLSAHVNIFNDVRVFYSISNTTENDPVYYPFPGYNNLDVNGNVIDISASDGLSDKKVVKTDVLSSNTNDVLFNDYTFTADDLPEFRYFSIKIIGSSTSQSNPPRIKDLRVIALA